MRSSTKIDPKNRPDGNPSNAPTHKRPLPSMVVEQPHTLNQFRLTRDTCSPLEPGGAKSMLKIREDATIADVLVHLFGHDGEFEFFDGVVKGVAEELEVLGCLVLEDIGSAKTVAQMLLRLSSRLDLCLAFEQRNRQEPRDEEDDDRASGEFAVGEVAS